MAKSNKVLKMEHRDSLVIWEVSEDYWDNEVQARIKKIYRKVGEKVGAPTPPEAEGAGK